MNSDAELSSKPPASGRQRTRQACVPCRSMKRKCDGHLPCGVCQRFEYDCYFEAHARKRPRLSSKDASLETADCQAEPPAVQQVQPGPVQTGERTVLPSAVGTKTPHPMGPHQLLSLTWNLGLREKPTFRIPSLSGVSISQDELSGLARVFFEKVHPLYGFVDVGRFDHKLAKRFSEPQLDDRYSQSYDSLLCGVAAIGALFTGGNAHEQELAECARQSLEVTNVSEPPALDHLAAWLIRTLYLRYTSAPHAAWISSCVAMHVAEALGLHQGEREPVGETDTELNAAEIDRQRRLFWVAKVLNSAISWECGRSGIELRNVSCKAPTLHGNDLIVDLIFLYQQSNKLDLNQGLDIPELELVLNQVENFRPRHNALVLSQTNIVFGVYRRIRGASHTVSRTVLDRVIAQGQKGLKAALDLSNAGEPWWHCGNIPFQFVCALLAIDTRESLAHVRDSLETLQLVVQQFDTQTTREMLRTATTLVHVFKQRKEEAAKVLSHSVNGDYLLHMLPGEQLQHTSAERQVRPSQPAALQETPQPAASGMSFDAFDPMDFSDPNWDVFSNIDFPIFESTEGAGHAASR